MKTNKTFFKIIYSLLLFVIVFVVASLISKYFVANFENYGINCNRVEGMPTDKSTFSFKMILIFFNPITEEILYRLGLKYSKRNTTFFILGILITISFFFKNIIDFKNTFTVLFFLFFCVLLFFGIRYFVSKNENQIKEIYENHFNYIFLISVLVFAYSHFPMFENYDELKNILLSPIILINYIIAGILYGFVRIKYGFWQSVLCHMMWNAIVIYML